VRGDIGFLNYLQTLFVEIRDLQREHLTEYRMVTQQSLELQQRSIARQERFAGLYRRVVAAAATLIVVIVIIIVLLMGRIFR
jgi:ABC-type glycerol-3-phosphate transport system permease component